MIFRFHFKRSIDAFAYDEACEDARRYHAQAKRLLRALENERLSHMDDALCWHAERERLIEERDTLAGQVLRLEMDEKLKELWS